MKFNIKNKKVVIISVVSALALTATGVWFFSKKKPANNQNLSYIRTTTLSKGTITQSVSATGTVESVNVSNVTTQLNYTVKSIAVNEGDVVEEGDVILVLDTSELLSNIEKEEENLKEKVEKAQKTYDSAYTSLSNANQAKIDAEALLKDAKEQLVSAESDYQRVLSSVEYYQKQYDDACKELEDLGLKLNEAEVNYLQFDASLDGYDEIKSNYEQAKVNYQNMESVVNDYKNQLQKAKQQINFDTYKNTYDQASKNVETAENNVSNANKNVENCVEQVDTASENLESSKTSETLTNLKKQLEQCTLRAETSGTITSLNATVGSKVNGTAAVIQDTEDLVVSISIEEYDINNLKVGMRAIITSDATDNEIAGELTQMAAVATTQGMGSSSSSFSAQVKVTGDVTGLKIGMNAKCEIVISETNDVFNVPLDAIETDEDGKTYVYEKISGSGMDMEFEKVEVIVGEGNDYYVEISGENVYAGMVVRSSAVLEEAIADGSEEVNNMFDMSNFPGGDFSNGGFSGGNMPSGGGNRPSGNMPSGFPGGN